MFARTVVTAAALALSSVSSVFALQPQLSEDGFNPAALAALDAQLDALAAQGHRPGYAAIIARGEEIVFTAEAGVSDLENATPFTIDTPVRIASMTKPVTVLAAMMLVESGELGLDDPVSDYIPSFADMQVAVSPMANADGQIETRPASTVMTVRHLMTHTAGLGYLFEAESDLGRLYLENSLYVGEGNLEARMEQLSGLILYSDPGERWFYSYSNDVLGRVVEVVSETPFEDFMEERIFEPLGMHSTGFFFEDTDLNEEDMSPLYIHTETGEMVEFEQANPDWASGGGGLVSTGTDYIRFAMMLANGGALGDVRLIQPQTLTQMGSPQVTNEQLGGGWGAASYGFGLAVVLPPLEGQEPQGVPGDISWGGMFDTDFFASPATGVSAVLMTQIQPSPHRPEPRSSDVFRPMVYGSMVFED